MQIPNIIHLSVGRKGWSTTGSFVGFVSNMERAIPGRRRATLSFLREYRILLAQWLNMERATSGLDVHFLEWREDRCLYGWTCRI